MEIFTLFSFIIGKVVNLMKATPVLGSTWWDLTIGIMVVGLGFRIIKFYLLGGKDKIL